MATNRHPIAPSHADQPGQSAGHLVLYHYRNAAQGDNPENSSLPFLAGQPHGEFVLPQPKRTSDLLSLTILLAILATSCATTLFAWSSTHSTPNIIPSAHASISSTATLPRGDAYPNAPTPTHRVSPRTFNRMVHAGLVAQPMPRLTEKSKMVFDRLALEASVSGEVA
jgi:hypothetical protein